MLNTPAHSPSLTAGMSIPISCKHFSRLKDPDCRQPNCDSAPCGFPGICPGWLVGTASPSPTCPVGRHLLIHPHLPLPQADNATARAPQHHPLPCCNENSRLTGATLIFLEHGSCCWHPGRSTALLPVGSGNREGVFHARLEDNPSTTLNQRLDFPSLCSRQPGNAPRRMQELGTRFEPSLWGCAAAAHFILPQKCIQRLSQQLNSLKIALRGRRQGREQALLALT